MYTEEEITALKQVTPLISQASEGGYTFILIDNLPLPDGCMPSHVTALLCPTPMGNGGYQSRLLLSERITGCGAATLNWTEPVRAFGKNWQVFSWNHNPGLDLVNKLFVHLRAIRYGKQ